MAIGQDHEYHRGRAQAELDWAYRAENRQAAEAHMRLSAMHMERLRKLHETASAV